MNIKEEVETPMERVESLTYTLFCGSVDYNVDKERKELNDLIDGNEELQELHEKLKAECNSYAAMMQRKRLEKFTLEYIMDIVEKRKRERRTFKYWFIYVNNHLYDLTLSALCYLLPRRDR